MEKNKKLVMLVLSMTLVLSLTLIGCESGSSLGVEEDEELIIEDINHPEELEQGEETELSADVKGEGDITYSWVSAHEDFEFGKEGEEVELTAPEDLVGDIEFTLSVEDNNDNENKTFTIEIVEGEEDDEEDEEEKEIEEVITTWQEGFRENDLSKTRVNIAENLVIVDVFEGNNELEGYEDLEKKYSKNHYKNYINNRFLPNDSKGSIEDFDIDFEITDETFEYVNSGEHLVEGDFSLEIRKDDSVLRTLSGYIAFLIDEENEISGLLLGEDKSDVEDFIENERQGDSKEFADFLEENWSEGYENKDISKFENVLNTEDNDKFFAEISSLDWKKGVWEIDKFDFEVIEKDIEPLLKSGEIAVDLTASITTENLLGEIETKDLNSEVVYELEYGNDKWYVTNIEGLNIYEWFGSGDLDEELGESVESFVESYNQREVEELNELFIEDFYDNKEVAGVDFSQERENITINNELIEKDSLLETSSLREWANKDDFDKELLFVDQIDCEEENVTRVLFDLENQSLEVVFYEKEEEFKIIKIEEDISIEDIFGEKYGYGQENISNLLEGYNDSIKSNNLEELPFDLEDRALFNEILEEEIYEIHSLNFDDLTVIRSQGDEEAKVEASWQMIKENVLTDNVFRLLSEDKPEKALDVEFDLEYIEKEEESVWELVDYEFEIVEDGFEELTPKEYFFGFSLEHETIDYLDYLIENLKSETVSDLVNINELNIAERMLSYQDWDLDVLDLDFQPSDLNNVYDLEDKIKIEDIETEIDFDENGRISKLELQEETDLTVKEKLFGLIKTPFVEINNFFEDLLANETIEFGNVDENINEEILVRELPRLEKNFEISDLVLDVENISLDNLEEEERIDLEILDLETVDIEENALQNESVTLVKNNDIELESLNVNIEDIFGDYYYTPEQEDVLDGLFGAESESEFHDYLADEVETEGFEGSRSEFIEQEGFNIEYWNEEVEGYDFIDFVSVNGEDEFSAEEVLNKEVDQEVVLEVYSNDIEVEITLEKTYSGWRINSFDSVENIYENWFGLDEEYIVSLNEGENFDILSDNEIGEVSYGESVEFEIDIEEGYEFDEIVEDYDGKVSYNESENLIEVENVQQEKDIEIEVELKEYTVSLNEGDNFDIIGEDEYVVNHGGSRDFEIDIKEGYEFDEIVDDYDGKVSYNESENLIEVENVQQEKDIEIEVVEQ